jgi:hypothetical protein
MRTAISASVALVFVIVGVVSAWTITTQTSWQNGSWHNGQTAFQPTSPHVILTLVASAPYCEAHEFAPRYSVAQRSDLFDECTAGCPEMNDCCAKNTFTTTGTSYRLRAVNLSEMQSCGLTAGRLSTLDYDCDHARP